MFKGARISLANKCQLLFGAAVVLILTAALSVVSLRMQSQVEQRPRERAQDLAETWLADQIQLSGALTVADQAVGGLAPDASLSVSLIEKSEFDRLAEQDAFLRSAIDRFQLRAKSEDDFEPAVDAEGQPYYRYARAIRKSDLSRVGGGTAGGGRGFRAGVDTTALADPLELLLLIQLRDEHAAAQQMVNRIYIVAAGTFAGLLAIAVFWFITTRLILSPVRLLRDVASKVSAGDLNIRSDINTGDEFEELSDVFNQMLSSQKEKQDQLRSINKSLDLKLDELAASNISLYEANKIKGEFLANVSHELRTPLNAMLGFAEVLQESLPESDDPIDEKRRRYVANIINSSRRLLDLINDLLDLAKIEAGRLDLNVTTINLADTCEGLINLIRPQAEKRQVTLRLKIESNLPVVQTDAGRLQQILFNFLANAVKFAPDGGTVTMAAARVAQPQDDGKAARELRIAISDTGPGIAPEDHHRIFEKFTQLDPGVTKRYGGTGLGLTISRDLATMLQGRIEVDSDLGRGATFILTIPTVLEQRSVPLMPDLSLREPTGR